MVDDKAEALAALIRSKGKRVGSGSAIELTHLAAVADWRRLLLRGESAEEKCGLGVDETDEKSDFRLRRVTVAAATRVHCIFVFQKIVNN